MHSRCLPVCLKVPDSHSAPLDFVADIARTLADAEAKVQTAIAGVDARAAFASYALTRLTSSQSNYHSKPAPAGVEHAAWLLYPKFDKGVERDPALIQEVMDAIEEHAKALTSSEIFSSIGTEPDHLQTHLRLHSGIVRGSAYPQQISRRIDMLFAPFEDELALRIGIGPRRAAEIIRVLAGVTEEKINADRARYWSRRAEYQKLDGKKHRIEAEEAQLIELAKEVSEIIGRMGGGWVPSKDDIRAAGCTFTDAEWCSLRELIGMTPSARSALATIVDVQDRPMFFLDNDHAFYVHGGQCLDAIFNAFDEIA